MAELVGWEFPGGAFTIEGWENFLMYDVTLGDPPRHGFAHPMYAFHAPLAGMGISYQGFFDLCHAESADRIRAGEYDFVYRHPIRENTTYAIGGEVESVERKRGGRAGLFDLVRFRLDMTDPDGSLACSAGNSWIFLRGDDGSPPGRSPMVDPGRSPDPSHQSSHRSSHNGRGGDELAVSHREPVPQETSGLETGDWRPADDRWRMADPTPLEPTQVGSVSAEKMKILAAILRDPNVIHIDADVVRERGLGDKRINQGPTNLGYVTNMLEANFGPGSITRLQVRFGANVFEDDTVTAGGNVVARSPEAVQCEVWLQREDGTAAVSGSADVRLA